MGKEGVLIGRSGGRASLVDVTPLFDLGAHCKKVSHRHCRLLFDAEQRVFTMENLGYGLQLLFCE